MPLVSCVTETVVYMIIAIDKMSNFVTKLQSTYFTYTLLEGAILERKGYGRR